MATSSTGTVAKLRLVTDATPSTPTTRTPALDDSELLAAVRAGDARAATAFHDRMRPQVERTVGRLLGRQDADREDLVQQALIELVTTIDRYRGECSLDSWASTIAAHIVYKHIRRRKVERRIFRALAPEVLAQTRSSLQAGRDAMLRNAASRVLEHLDTLDEAKVWAFVLHDVCGFDLHEVARITRVNVSAAQTRLVRGRREVHALIANDPELAGLLESVEGES
jgi:RNA polymerase sigma-70 factor (ECF subfamily)